MKKMLVMILASFAAAASSDRPAQPLLQKVFRTSEAAPVSEVTCTLWPDRLVIERTTEDLKDVETSPIQITGGDIGGLIRGLSATDTPVKPANPNAALTQWLAYDPAAPGARPILLQSEGPLAGSNPDPAAQRLVQFIELHCRPCYLGMRM
jgi:hypothetical protein